MSDIVQTTTLRDNLSGVLESVEQKKPDWLLITRKGKARTAIVNLEFFEDLLALASPKYLKSIKEARQEIKNGEWFTHKQVFGEL